MHHPDHADTSQSEIFVQMEVVVISDFIEDGDIWSTQEEDISDLYVRCMEETELSDTGVYLEITRCFYRLDDEVFLSEIVCERLCKRRFPFSR